MYNLRDFQTQNLFLLVGTNPLPNYVAAKLLLKTNGCLYLIHTDETAAIADRLIAKLKLVLEESPTKCAEGKQGGRAIKILVNEAKSDDIFPEVSRCAEGKQDVGLNYTGGTKTMAVHAYRAVEHACPEAVFSYLDARSLKMVIEKKERFQQELLVALAISPQFETLLALHGYTLKHEPIQDVMHPEVCRKLAQNGVQWRKWCDDNLRSGPDTNFRNKGQLSEVLLPCIEGVDWQECRTLGDLATKWEMKVDRLAKWLDGTWLEHFTLWALKQIAYESQIHQVGMNIEAKRQNESENRSFELDVMAMRGYQLFAISCTTGSKKGALKSKLFEAYVRARQMGGDEARVGLVCCAPKDNPDSSPPAIQREIEEAWDARGKVRVFGAEHLPDLPAYLKDWFDSQS